MWSCVYVGVVWWSQGESKGQFCSGLIDRPTPLIFGRCMGNYDSRGENDAHGPATRISGPQDCRGKRHWLAIVRRDFLICISAKAKILKKGFLRGSWVIRRGDGPCLVRDM